MVSSTVPPEPLKGNPLPITIGVVVGFVAIRELRRRGIDRPGIRGVGLGLAVALLSVFSLPVGVFSGVVSLLVRG